MRPIGFSTGALALSDFRLALEEPQGLHRLRKKDRFVAPSIGQRLYARGCLGS
jgi:hypothetical protein